VFGSNTRDAGLLPFGAFWPSSGPLPVGCGLSPEFVLRMVKTQSLDGKRYFFSLG
jgi:hypothetical protein